VVVAGDNAGANVDAFADDRVAQVGEVVGFGAPAKRDLLGLDEVADVSLGADAALRTKMRIRAKQSAVIDLGAIEDAAIADGNVVAKSRGLDDGVRTDPAVAADACGAETLHVRLNDGVRADLDLRIDDAGVRTKDGDALGHQATGTGHAYGLIKVHHLGVGIGAEDFIDALSLMRNHAQPVGDEHGGDVRKVELSVGVVGREAVEAREEFFGLEAIDARVDLAGIALIGLKRLVLDDCGYFREIERHTQHAAVAC